jgi:hypothetical protein
MWNTLTAIVSVSTQTQGKYQAMGFLTRLLNPHFTGIETCGDGTRKWYRNGQYHREDGPAIEWADGGKWWYRNGPCHRDDGPAVEYADGTKAWYRNGLCHRDDGPAFEWVSGSEAWYREGLPMEAGDIARIKTLRQEEALASVGVRPQEISNKTPKSRGFSL